MKNFPLLFLAWTSMLLAEDFLPEVAPLAKKYDADSAVLAEKRAAAVAPLRQQYLVTVEAALKLAAAEGQPKAIAALNVEKEALQASPMPLANIPDLPKSIQVPRKAYTDALLKVAGDFSAQQTRLMSDYVNRLNFLPGKSKPALAAQIEAEKERAKQVEQTANSAGGISRNFLVNGDFSQKDEAGQPTGWTGWSGDASKVTILPEEGNSFVRVKGTTLRQTLTLPPNAKEVRLSMRCRVADAEDCGLFLSGRDSAGNQVTVLGQHFERVGGKWKTVTLSGRVKGKMLSFTAAFSAGSGTADFDDLSLEAN